MLSEVQSDLGILRWSSIHESTWVSIVLVVDRPIWLLLFSVKLLRLKSRWIYKGIRQFREDNSNTWKITFKVFLRKPFLTVLRFQKLNDNLVNEFDWNLKNQNPSLYVIIPSPAKKFEEIFNYQFGTSTTCLWLYITVKAGTINLNVTSFFTWVHRFSREIR